MVRVDGLAKQTFVPKDVWFEVEVKKAIGYRERAERPTDKQFVEKVKVGTARRTLRGLGGE